MLNFPIEVNVYPSRKNMEVFRVASMRAGKIFEKTWKIQRACIEFFLQNIHATCKIYQNLKEFYETL